DRIALVDGPLQLSYRAFADRLSQMAQALGQIGLTAGDGLAQLSSNCVDAVVVQLTCYLLGIRYVPLHPLGSADDHAYILQDSDVKAFVYEPDGFEAHAGKILAAGHRPAHVLPHDRLHDTAERQRPGPLAASTDPEGVVALLYTGGTTGRSKGVTLTSRAMMMNVFLSLTEWEWPSTITFLCATPVTHASGCMLVPIL